MLWFLITLIMINTSGAAMDFRRYHRTVGIPAAQRRLEMERRIMESGDDAVNTRIIGGHKADHLEFPWLAGVLIELQSIAMVSLCSGTLITSSRVVTAAHCYMDDEASGTFVDVILGSDYVYYGGTRVRSYDVVVHPGSYVFDKEKEFSVDVALIFFPAVDLNTKIKPIVLPTKYKTQSFAGYAAFAAGFGKIRNNPEGADKEQNRYVELEVLPNSKCNIRVGDYTLMCTSGKGKVGICFGDSGGPLSTKICGEDVLIGLIGGLETHDCESGHTSHYIRATEVMDWFALFMNGLTYPIYSNVSLSKPRKF